ncbi:MAG: hypothetical protein C4297_03070 [Gemmataceae bacterium]
MTQSQRSSGGFAYGRYVRGLAPFVLLMFLLWMGLAYAVFSRAQVMREADEEALREWLTEARTFRKTLPEMVRDYLAAAQRKTRPAQSASAAADNDDRHLNYHLQEIQAHLDALGQPIKLYREQLPLFPAIYRIELRIYGEHPQALAWDSAWPRRREQIRTLEFPLVPDEPSRATLRVEYELHAFSRKEQEEARQQRVSRLALLAAAVAAVLTVLWTVYFLRRERHKEWHEFATRQRLADAERRALELQVRRDEMERELLLERVNAEQAKRQASELKSQLYASIGIMAASYAHNIKNLLVRPRDLLQRCVESAPAPQIRSMLEEVQHTLHTVTHRLQLILRTVRRDPSSSETALVDLNLVAKEAYENWHELAADRWKLDLVLECAPDPLILSGDRSHLLQAVENLLFNARDATFEMRNFLREAARSDPGLTDAERRQRLIEAASWRGKVSIRTGVRSTVSAEPPCLFLEVADNGIGMDDATRRQCTEPHFSTKRDNALYEGNTTGMGLGLSFVQLVVAHHQGSLDIESSPKAGTTVRMRFPATRAFTGSSRPGGEATPAPNQSPIANGQ